ncbi:hypothetical protein GOP47_0023775 [Adiantum capillus-veneris]|uniref:Phospholipase A(2) n=1 Tax=Adiantum capillus-veneris TaxID=13818 RepID=A0A9D4Z4W3_ADICA|nr:hypothetical protein GOP47_0023775 [Adiantum capillus-veneris]
MAAQLSRTLSLASHAGLCLAFIVIFLAYNTQPSCALIVNTSDLLPCGNTCESSDCIFPPLLRYGKYCGIGYTGCDGETPCDNLDVCCQTHDACIGDDPSNYLNVTCNQNLLDCVSNFQNSDDPQFDGATCGKTTVCTTIKIVMEIATHLDEQNK